MHIAILILITPIIAGAQSLMYQAYQNAGSEWRAQFANMSSEERHKELPEYGGMSFGVVQSRKVELLGMLHRDGEQAFLCTRGQKVVCKDSVFKDLFIPSFPANTCGRHLGIQNPVLCEQRWRSDFTEMLELWKRSFEAEGFFEPASPEFGRIVSKYPDVTFDYRAFFSATSSIASGSWEKEIVCDQYGTIAPWLAFTCTFRMGNQELLNRGVVEYFNKYCSEEQAVEGQKENCLKMVDELIYAQYNFFKSRDYRTNSFKTFIDGKKKEFIPMKVEEVRELKQTIEFIERVPKYTHGYYGPLKDLVYRKYNENKVRFKAEELITPPVPSQDSQIAQIAEQAVQVEVAKEANCEENSTSRICDSYKLYEKEILPSALEAVCSGPQCQTRLFEFKAPLLELRKGRIEPLVMNSAFPKGSSVFDPVKASTAINRLKARESQSHRFMSSVKVNLQLPEITVAALPKNPELPIETEVAEICQADGSESCINFATNLATQALRTSKPRKLSNEVVEAKRQSKAKLLGKFKEMETEITTTNSNRSSVGTIDEYKGEVPKFEPAQKTPSVSADTEDRPTQEYKGHSTNKVYTIQSYREERLGTPPTEVESAEIIKHVEQNPSEYATTEEDSLFQSVSKAYGRNLNKILKAKPSEQ